MFMPKSPNTSAPAAAAPDAYEPDATVKLEQGTSGGNTGQVRLSGKKKRVQKDLPGLGL